MNTALEFHDSKINSIRHTASALHVVFSKAIVHQSEGRPGIDPGVCGIQTVEVVFGAPQVITQSGPCLGTVSDASLSISGIHCELLQIPISLPGHIVANFVLTDNSSISLTAASVHSEAQSAYLYVEPFPGTNTD